MIKLLYFLSKTDSKLVVHCTAYTKNIQATLGCFVLLTGVLAFLSGSYAIANLFVIENPQTGKPEMIDGMEVVVILLGLFYTVFIMAIDREVVSAHSRWAALTRLFLAFVIGVVVSTPIKLRLFESRIEKHLQEKIDAENAPIKEEAGHQYEEGQNRLKQLVQFKNDAVHKRIEWSEAMDAEITGSPKEGRSHRPGEGRAYREAKRNFEFQDAEVIRLDSEIILQRKIVDETETQKDSIFKHDKRKQSYDLLSRYVALHEIEELEDGGTAWIMGWGVSFLFILLEVIPSLLKLFLPQTEYDELIDKRRRIHVHAVKLIFQKNYAEYGRLTDDQIQVKTHEVVEKMLQTVA